jgi:phage pi2 protein 07
MAKKKFYANINENLDELKSANGKLYWKTMNMLIKNENSSNETHPNILFTNFNIRENIQASTIKIR